MASTGFACTAALLLLLLQISAGAGAGAAADCHFPAVFNFGDSNSDTGGLSAAFGAAPPPNGMTFFGMPVGRYCDGRLVIDFIAESVGVPYLSAYLNSVGSNFSQGANFATAGSSISRQNTSLFLSGFSPISLDVQSWEFEQFINRSQFVYNNKGGIYRELLPKAEYFSQALYTFDIGQNDITAGYFANMTTEEVIAYIPDLMDRFTSIILGGQVDASSSIAWSSRLPSKIKIFCQLTDAQRLSSRANLFFKGCAPSDACERCAAPESCHHIFYSCPVSVAVWTRVGVSLTDIPISLWDIPPLPHLSLHLDVWRLGIAALMWSLWKARNDATFNGVDSSPTQILRRCTDDITLWGRRLARVHDDDVLSLHTYFRACSL